MLNQKPLARRNFLVADIFRPTERHFREKCQIHAKKRVFPYLVPRIDNVPRGPCPDRISAVSGSCGPPKCSSESPSRGATFWSPTFFANGTPLRRYLQLSSYSPLWLLRAMENGRNSAKSGTAKILDQNGEKLTVQILIPASKWGASGRFPTLPSL